MTNLNLELKINCASNLLNVNLFTKMDVFAKISIRAKNTPKKQKAKTSVDRSAGSNPIWNQTINFSVNERLVHNDHLKLVIKLISRRVLRNKEIGRVDLSLLELFNSITPPINGDSNSEKMNLMRYQVITRSGKKSGTLTFSYRFKSDLMVNVNRHSVNTPPSFPPQPQIDHRPSSPTELPIAYPPSAPPELPIAYPPSAPPELPITYPPSAPPEPIAYPPSAPPEFPTIIPRLPWPPSHSRHSFAAGSSNGPLPPPILSDVMTLEQFNHAYNNTLRSLSSRGIPPVMLNGYAPPAPPPSPTRYG
ncbi:protein SRC2 [Capsella rubella]|uniref:protein SRC2 n=1 Tax=Capsella rubella TaxID=81985 RepID=UPI000CD5352C|nr:protein SRC2 [Capsella rubella]